MANVDSKRRQGQPCWIDLVTRDARAAARFYGAVLGWEFEVSGPEYGNYHLAKVGGRLAAGIGESDNEAFPSAWTVYFTADDIAAMTAEATRLGATVMMPAMEIPGQGHMAILLDPTGAAFGLWQTIQHPGFQVRREPGAVSWFEVRTPDVEAAGRFYAALLGATVATEEGTGSVFLTHGDDGGSIGGIERLSGDEPGARPHWATYFTVGDIEQALAAVTANGGKMVRAAHESPHGQLATASDPYGAHFSLVQESA
ncbi:MAG TPA: VOC family protein [Trueperaceae bacterium]|nr:VOC family protein [Trueperaceae bacterium]